MTASTAASLGKSMPSSEEHQLTDSPPATIKLIAPIQKLSVHSLENVVFATRLVIVRLIALPSRLQNARIAWKKVGNALHDLVLLADQHFRS